MKIRILIAGLCLVTATLFAAGNVQADGYRGRGDRHHGSDRHYYNKHRPNRGHHQPPGHWKRYRHGRGKWKDRDRYGRHEGQGRHGRGYRDDRPRYRDHYPKDHCKKPRCRKPCKKHYHKKHYRYYPPLPRHFLGLSILQPGFAFSIGGYDR
ncbi:MAG: hypothetical protein ACOCW9_04345 [Thermodesulfobacteriota bacterium]